MSIYFGTDGIRGKFNDDLSVNVAYNCGNALGSEGNNLKIIIGKDTRSSGDILSLAFASGAMNAGADVTNVGICPTAGISYLTKTKGFDYGVVISASHNPAEFNGIKIFDKTGRKISELQEEYLEKKFIKQVSLDFSSVGKYYHKEYLVKHYLNYMKNIFNFDLTGKTVILDCSNGASSYIAKRLFLSKGARVYALSCKPNGTNINKDCGSLHISRLKREVIRKKADFGFAYDGDSDRIVAISEKGEVLSGDVLIYIFSMYYKQIGKLSPATVVGTRHTNMGVEKTLKNQGISLIRADIGDKYVSAKLVEKDLLIGGEQSGHIIVRDMLPTGDGILNSLFLTYICVTQKSTLSKLGKVELYKQSNVNVEVMDKMQVINNEKVSLIINEKENELLNIGRIMIRVSGTEPCIRVMVETENEELSKQISNDIVKVIKQVDNELKMC